MIALNITHGDDNAVAVLAMAMVSKLAQARAKGRSGWDTPECTQQHLSNLLREHVAKGDPVDVANFCAFLTARGEGIAEAAPAAIDRPTLVAELAAHVDRLCNGLEQYRDGAGTWCDADDEELATARALVTRAEAPALEAPAAPANDIRDAALWREHVQKLDALVAYCPTCTQGFAATGEMTRDQIIFECGKTAGRSAAAPQAPAAPTEPHGLTKACEAVIAEWSRQKGLFPVLSRDGWMDDRIADLRLAIQGAPILCDAERHAAAQASAKRD